jgi:hypothetical protein
VKEGKRILKETKECGRRRRKHVKRGGKRILKDTKECGRGR